MIAEWLALDCSTRRFLVDYAQFGQMLRGAILHAFQNEDKPMLEKQQARIGTADFWDLEPILLPGVAAAVRVRRLLAKMIRQEQAGGC